MLVLFFPVFMWMRNRFTAMMSRARLVFGSMSLNQAAQMPPPGGAAGQKKGEEPVPKPSHLETEESPWGKMEPRLAEESKKAPPSPPVSPVAEEIDKELFPEQAPVKTEAAGAPVHESEAVQASAELEAGGAEAVQAPVMSVKEEKKIEEKLRTNPTLLLMDTKHSLYKKKNLDIPFIQTISNVYHSKTSSGSYLLYQQKEGYHLYVMFSYPDVNLEFAAEQLKEIANCVQTEFEESEDKKSVLKGLNDYCVENNIHIDASVVTIDESEEKVAYTSCGEGYALYLKHNEETVKDLKLDLVGLGRCRKMNSKRLFPMQRSTLLKTTSSSFYRKTLLRYKLKEKRSSTY